MAGISWLSGYYQLAPGAAPQYSGGISLFRAAAAGNGASSALQFSEVTLETDAGIFDMTTTTTTAAAAGVAGPGGAPTRVEGGKAVLACCTDGSLRVWQPPSSTANPSLTTIAEGISEHMITSCSEIPSEDGMFLCTAHQGECLVVTTASSNTGHEMVTQQQQQQPPPPPERQSLASHSYDAWCGAIIPSTAVLTMEGGNDGSGHDTASTGQVLLTGGDDGLLKVHQQRHGSVGNGDDEGPVSSASSSCGGGSASLYDVVREYSFDAGVVSIAPVYRVAPCHYRRSFLSWGAGAAATDGEGSRCGEEGDGSVFSWEQGNAPRFHTHHCSGDESGYCTPTPYVLVGSYDESIHLIDLRMRGSKRGVIASRSCGGGVWRCHRTLFPYTCSTAPSVTSLSAGKSARGSMVELGAGAGGGGVSDRNVLLLPLMQGGAGMLSYSVLGPESEVFGREVHPFPFPEQQQQSDQLLIYDTALLHLQLVKASAVTAAGWHDTRDDDTTCSSEEGLVLRGCVASTSFYTREVSCFKWHGPSAASSMEEVITSLS